ncbi:MAG TPA: hypothetical protein VG365_00480 [Solirubrobacteraceae bacterium]|jgi:hypothetical protein|nr:hypothetical protein [Solirubrobacteraceae bacterium]
MSDVEIEQIRGANPFPDELPAPPIELVLQRLEREAGAQPASRWRVRVPSVGGIFATTSVLLAVVIAVVALADLGRHTRVSHATPPALPARQRTATTSQQGAATQRQQVAPARAVDVSDAVLGYLLPRDGADFAAGQSLVAFARAVDVKAETQCMAAEGLPGPSVSASPDGRFGSVEMPNMPLITRTLSLGLTERYSPPTNPADSLPPSQQRAYRTALARCVKATPQVLAAVQRRPVGGMLDTWMNNFSALTSSPAIRSLNRRAQACSRATGFAADSPGSEAEAIESKVMPANLHGHAGQANVIQASGARVLIRCFGAIITRETRLLTARRVQFVAAHADVIHEAEHETSLAIHAAAAKYGITFDAADAGAP